MKPAPLRAVLDTNVLVSALLFNQGRLIWLRPCLQQGQLTPVLAEPTARELLRVLAYPKFRLQAADRERLLEDLLPWCESWTAAIPSSTHRVRDSHDQVFPPAPWPSRANCGGHRLPSPVFVFIGTLLWSILIERMSP